MDILTPLKFLFENTGYRPKKPYRPKKNKGKKNKRPTGYSNNKYAQEWLSESHQFSLQLQLVFIIFNLL